jgi:magnesium chelatase family protein
MVCKVISVAYEGVEVKPVEVQVQIAPGGPAINIVGLANKAVAESKERIRAAFHTMSLSFPQRKITVNLAPADLLKDGSHYDLAIALGIMAESKLINIADIEPYWVVGELSLDGLIKPVRGVLPATIGAGAGGKGIICPAANGAEATWSGNQNILATPDLMSLVNHFSGQQVIEHPHRASIQPKAQHLDFLDVKGQLFAKRALEIAAAGGHNLLMIGPPGSGKSMLAKRLPGILPPLSTPEILENSIICSIAGLMQNGTLISERPFRSPHNSASLPAMMGGGRSLRPGEVTLAHNGVLFLDELPQFPTNILDALRQPIEDGKIAVSRISGHVVYPAKFQLIAAMNPCKCGNFGDANSMCNKAPHCAADYQSKISGPLFDRFDLRVDVVQEDIFTLPQQQTGIEDSASIAARVSRAREIQTLRYSKCSYKLNSSVEGSELDKVTKLDEAAQELVKRAMQKFSLSMRGYTRILRVARTIADLANADSVNSHHIAEAINFRMTKLKA